VAHFRTTFALQCQINDVRDGEAFWKISDKYGRDLTLINHIPCHSIHNFLHHFDIVASARRGVFEALACGLPVVATAVDGIPEQIEEGRSGFLIPAGDAQAMADRVLQLLVNNSLRASISSTAADIAVRSFGVQKQVQAYLDWYEQILSSSQAGSLKAYAC